MLLLLLAAGLCAVVRGDAVELDGDTLVLDSTQVRRLRFGDCDVSAAVTVNGLAMCVPPATSVQFGPVTVTVDGTATVATATNGGAVLWRTLAGYKTLVGTQIPVDAASLPDNSVVVVGTRVERSAGPWVAHSETLFVAQDGLASDATTMQQVTLAGNSGIRGVRVAGGDGAVVVLRTGEIVVGDDVSGAFVADSIGRGHTVITRSVVTAAEAAAASATLPLVQMPVTGVRDRLHVTYYSEGCGRFTWRKTALYELGNMNCTEKADWPGMSGLLGTAYASAMFDCVSGTWARYPSAACAGTVSNVSLPLGNCTAGDTMRLVCASAT
jgi:hypothetical protein